MGLWEYGASSVIVEDVHLIKSIVTVCFLIFCNFIGASIQVSFLFVVEISVRGDSLLFLICGVVTGTLAA